METCNVLSSRPISSLSPIVYPIVFPLVLGIYRGIWLWCVLKVLCVPYWVAVTVHGPK